MKVPITAKIIGALIFIGIAIYLFYQLIKDTRIIRIAQQKEIPVFCNEEDLMDAWVRGERSKTICPDFSNRLIVNHRELFLKEVENSRDCCWFSEREEDWTKIIQPDVCNAGKVFTEEELNQKPYVVERGGLDIERINPSCDGDRACIELKKTAIDYSYQITKYELPGDTNYITTARIILKDSCGGMEDFTIRGDSVLQQMDDGTLEPTEDAPQYAKNIIEAYNRTRGFYPVPVISI